MTLSTAAAERTGFARRPKPSKDDFWIVSSYEFFEHPSARGALAERDRLAKAEPSKRFSVYRCNRTIRAPGADAAMMTLTALKLAKVVLDELLPPADGSARRTFLARKQAVEDAILAAEAT